MAGTKGLRRGTRKLFAKKFRQHGVEHLSTYMNVYKRGQNVDIKVNSAVHKGMPYKAYHGRTGKVFDVTRRAVGVVVNKRVKGKILPKRIHVRIEHVKPSRCNEDFVQRKQQRLANEKLIKEKGLKKGSLSVKRVPEQPRKAHFVSTKLPIVDVAPIKIDRAY